MSYSIQTLIYGVPVTLELAAHLRAMGFDDDEIEDLGFEMLYDQGEGASGYCGVKLAEFDECAGFIPLSMFNVKPTAAQMAEAETKIQRLPPEVEKLVPRADMFIIFSSS